MKKKKIITAIIISIIIIIAIIITIYYFGNKTNNNIESSIAEVLSDVKVEYDDFEENDTWDETNSTKILLKNTDVEITGSGASKEGKNIKITKAGTYYISGTLDDGTIIVEAGQDDNIQLVLDNASIQCSTSAAIYIKQNNKTVITLAENSINKLVDASTYILENSEENEPNATIFSKDNIVINGSGTLNIQANYEDAIASSDNVKIINGNIKIIANDDGIRGKDYVAITGGIIDITSNSDAIKVTNTEETDKGYIVIGDGNITIDAGQDGIQAESTICITGGIFNIKTGEGSGNSSTSNANWGMWNRQQSTTSSSDTTSAKAIKSETNISIQGGTFTINSSDDSIHTNGSIGITNGTFDISSGDDGIHANTKIVIDGGTFNIEKSYEAIESANIEINGGKIELIATDDGINAAGGVDGSSTNGRAGQNGGMQSETTGTITINGGYIYVNSVGDGIDINGSAYINGGTIIVNGPTDNGNGALDYDGELKMTGGTLIAAGSSGMLQTISNTSTQYCISTVFTNTQSANTLVNVSDSSGNNIITFAPCKTYQAILICSPNLEKGKSYTISTGGSCTGNSENGLYSGENYTGGTKLSTVTLSSIITSIGKASNTGMQPNNMNPGRR